MAAVALDIIHEDSGSVTDSGQTEKYVSFILGKETYAVSASTVNEVLRYTEITPVPGAPQAIMGIINLRGNVVTVLSARTMFGLPPAEIAEQSRIVIVDIADYSVGILVDRVVEVVDLDTRAMENSPNSGNESASQFMQGVYNREQELYILVNFARLDGMDTRSL